MADFVPSGNSRGYDARQWQKRSKERDVPSSRSMIGAAEVEARARIDDRLRQSLAKLKTNGTSEADVDILEAFLQMPETLARPSLIVRCRLQSGVFTSRVVVDKPSSRWRLETQFLPFFNRLRPRLEGDLDVLVLLSDTLYVTASAAPRFVELLHRAPFLRSDWLEGDPISENALSLPDFTLQDDDYGDDVRAVDRAARLHPFELREEVAKWRGRLTGPDYPDMDNRSAFPRYHLVLRAAERPDIIDARLTHYDNFRKTPSGLALQRHLDELLGGRVPEMSAADFTRYRYLLSADGVAATWGRVAVTLWTGSVLLMQNRWNQFFYPGLVAEEHYVPIADDFSDLVQKFDWLRSDPDRATSIAQAGRRFAQTFLTPQAIDDHFLAVLNACADLGRR